MIAYEITNTANGKRYIGITTRTLRQRWNGHVAGSRRVDATAPIYCAFRKHGVAAFTMREVARATSRADLFALEIILIAQAGSFWPNGYNATLGGEGVPGFHPPAGSRISNALDLTGEVYGRLAVLGRGPNAGVGIRSKVRWLCRCECSAERLVHASALKGGNTVSCGCWKAERAKRDGWMLNRSHGMTKTPTWIVWDGIKQLCRNAQHKSYMDFGGRGIKVCVRWMAFENFHADMGTRPPGLGLIRRDRNGDYEPGNCEWATHKARCRTSGKNRFISHDGRQVALAELAEEAGISRKLLRERLERGWPVERALTPVRMRRVTKTCSAVRLPPPAEAPPA